VQSAGSTSLLPRAPASNVTRCARAAQTALQAKNRASRNQRFLIIQRGDTRTFLRPRLSALYSFGVVQLERESTCSMPACRTSVLCYSLNFFFFAEILLPAQGLGAAGVRRCLGSCEFREPSLPPSLLDTFRPPSLAVRCDSSWRERTPQCQRPVRDTA